MGLKKIAVALALGGVMLAATATAAHAETLTNYELPEANLSLSVPDSWAMATRNGVQAHPEIFQQINVTDDQVQQILKQDNAYANTVAPDGKTEILAIVVDPKEGAQRIWNLNTCSDSLLKVLGDGVASQMKSVGFNSTFDDTYKNGNVTYLEISGSSTSTTDYYKQYYTIVNGRMTSITMHSYAAALTDDQLATLKQVADSVQFLSVIDDPDPSLDTSVAGGAVSGAARLIAVITLALIVSIVVIVVVFTVRNRKKAAQAAAESVPPQGPMPPQPPM